MEDKTTNLWIPDEGQHPPLTDTIQDVINAYLLYLEICNPDHLRNFRARLESDSDAAISEAIVFSWLRAQRYQPQIFESPSEGGVDYICLPEAEKPFLIEVTKLSKDAVEQKSGIPDVLDEAAWSFSMITPQLLAKVQKKAPQLKNHDLPRVLAICLTHVGSSLLLGTLAAEWLMISEPHIEMTIELEGKSSDSPQNVTDLRNAAFFKVKDGLVVPVRKSVSAIILISIWHNYIKVVGLLHPAAAVPFDYRTFGEIPFLRVDWPIDKTINLEWVIGRPKLGHFYHQKITITDKKLKGELT
jgi:hypothetical protein